MMLPLEMKMPFSDALMVALLGFVIVMIVLAVLAIFVKILSASVRKAAGGKSTAKAKEHKEETAVPASAPLKTPLQAELEKKAVAAASVTSTPGYVTLDGISEQDAAVVMAITAHRLSLPLERLSFASIKREPVILKDVSEQDAAAIMAITCDRLKTQPEKLYFKSIKLLED